MLFEHESTILGRARASINMSGDVVHQAASSPQGGEKSPNISIKRNLKTTEEHLNDQSIIKKKKLHDQSAVSVRTSPGDDVTMATTE